jgi:hypothetical protein
MSPRRKAYGLWSLQPPLSIAAGSGDPAAFLSPGAIDRLAMERGWTAAPGPYPDPYPDPAGALSETAYSCGVLENPSIRERMPFLVRVR